MVLYHFDDNSMEFLDHERNTSAEQQLQNMIDNYQQHVLKQKQHYQVNGNHYSSGLSSVHDHLKANGSSIDGPVRLRFVITASSA